MAEMAGGSSRILVVDDHDDYREVLMLALGREGFDVEGVADGFDALKQVERERPDLVILDVQLDTGADGFAVGRRLRDIGDVPILYLTAAERLEDRLAGFDAGADDYVTKGTPLSELFARVRALLRRSGAGSGEVLKVGDLVIDEPARVVRRDGQPVDLTRTEFELLVTLARNRGRVLSKDNLLSQVWGFDAYDPNLVEVHISALRRKLEEKGPRLIQTVRSIGYILRLPDEPRS
jgi:two-component system, OmpR family, response regulator